MCCAWSHYGNVFASAHQDGSVPVWDLRTGMLVAKYRCNRAARNVKFAKGPIDLLAVAEHQECVHLLDARKWEAVDDIKMQQMRPFRSTDDGLHISGMSFTPSVGQAISVIKPSICYVGNLWLSNSSRDSTAAQHSATYMGARVILQAFVLCTCPSLIFPLFSGCALYLPISQARIRGHNCAVVLPIAESPSVGCNGGLLLLT